jgi:hypothetical protein
MFSVEAFFHIVPPHTLSREKDSVPATILDTVDFPFFRLPQSRLFYHPRSVSALV